MRRQRRLTRLIRTGHPSAAVLLSHSLFVPNVSCTHFSGSEVAAYPGCKHRAAIGGAPQLDIRANHFLPSLDRLPIHCRTHIPFTLSHTLALSHAHT